MENRFDSDNYDRRTASEVQCKYQKFGHCKFGSTCKYYHAATECEKEECADIELCRMRHPKSCKYFAEYGYCKFGDFCSHTIRSGVYCEITSIKSRLA